MAVVIVIAIDALGLVFGLFVGLVALGGASLAIWTGLGLGAAAGVVVSVIHWRDDIGELLSRMSSAFTFRLRGSPAPSPGQTINPLVRLTGFVLSAAVLISATPEGLAEMQSVPLAQAVLSLVILAGLQILIARELSPSPPWGMQRQIQRIAALARERAINALSYPLPEDPRREKNSPVGNSLDYADPRSRSQSSGRGSRHDDLPIELAIHSGRHGHGFLYSREADAINRRIAATRGLLINDVWERIRLVVPVALRKATARQEFVVSCYRMATVSVLSLPLALLLWQAFLHPGPSWWLWFSAALLGLVPLTLATRSQIRSAYQFRADTIDLHSSELIHALQLPEPHSHAELVAMSGPLVSGVDRLDTMYAPARSESDTGSPILGEVGLEALQNELVRQIPDLVVMRLNECLEREREAMMKKLSPVVLTETDLEVLASSVAQHAAPRVSKDVKDSIASLGKRLDEDEPNLLKSSAQGAHNSRTEIGPLWERTIRW